MTATKAKKTKIVGKKHTEAMEKALEGLYIEGGAGDQVSEPKEPNKAEVAPEEKAAPKLKIKTFRAPVVELDGEYARRSFHVRLSREQGRGFRALADGLKLEGAKLKDGKLVKKPDDVIKWVCENLN
jgi:hypothetical protein